jgi:tight adherence protein C
MAQWISLLAFPATMLLVGGAVVLLRRKDLRAVMRARQLGGKHDAEAPLQRRVPELLARLPLVGSLRGQASGALRMRFARAGIYNLQAPGLFLTVRLLLVCGGLLLGAAIIASQVVSLQRALALGILAVGGAILLPGLWLDARVSRWQGALRSGLPDAMDMLVLCLEGGASLSASLQHVLSELRLAHPELGGEMDIVQHEMQLGKTAGEAMKSFGHRCQLEEVRALASVLLQNERFGVSVSKALRIHSDTMRQQRHQKAEEMAQKAAVKILFPTLLCIFPAIFIVILGPAALRIAAVVSQMR